MNKKLRLLVTAKCHNSCPLCCNKQFDLFSLPTVDRWNYEEIILTGGEPLSSITNVNFLIEFIKSIKNIQKAHGFPISKFYLYTSTHDSNMLIKVIKHLDGITYTPHNNEERCTLLKFTIALGYRDPSFYEDKSLRLNLFPEDYQELIGGVNGSMLKEFWEAKEIKWLKNCPVSEGEDFKRIDNLY